MPISGGMMMSQTSFLLSVVVWWPRRGSGGRIQVDSILVCEAGVVRTRINPCGRGSVVETSSEQNRATWRNLDSDLRESKLLKRPRGTCGELIQTRGRCLTFA